jgi:hypothetical protein
MAWNTENNTWTAPTSWTASGPSATSLISQFYTATPGAASMTGQQRYAAFQNWWQGGGNQAVMDAWNTEHNAWNTTYEQWQGDSDRTPFAYSGDYTNPTAPDFGSATSWQDAQLYGGDDPNTAEVETGEGIYAAIEDIAAELAKGSEQYNTEWMDQYAEQAGFADPEARKAWLEEARRLQTEYQDKVKAMVDDPTAVTPEQKKAIRSQQIEQEAQARRQAEKMYQETGSYAALQRASDELNRAAINDAYKMQMETALQNYSAALNATSQQTDIVMREVESGNASFRDYVNAKQTGLTAAMQMWQGRISQVIEQANQRIQLAQQNFDNDRALYEADYKQELAEYSALQDTLDAQGAAIQAAERQAMGEGNALDAMNQYYNMVLQPIVDQWNAEVVPPGDSLDGTTTQETGWSSVSGYIIGALLVAFGALVGFATFWTGAGAAFGGAIAAAGTGLITAEASD